MFAAVCVFNVSTRMCTIKWRKASQIPKVFRNAHTDTRAPSWYYLRAARALLRTRVPLQMVRQQACNCIKLLNPETLAVPTLTYKKGKGSAANIGYWAYLWLTSHQHPISYQQCILAEWVRYAQIQGLANYASIIFGIIGNPFCTSIIENNRLKNETKWVENSNNSQCMPP